MIRILFVLCFIHFNLSGQDLKLKTKYSDGVKEVFYQQKIKGEGKFKEGEYKKFLTSKYNPTILYEKGFFHKNKKAGVWTYYNLVGDSLFSYNHDTDSLLFVNKNADRISLRYRKHFSKATSRVFATSYAYNIDFSRFIPPNTSMPIYIEGDLAFYDLLFKIIMQTIGYYDSHYKTNEGPNFTKNFSSGIILKINKFGKLEDIQTQYTSDPIINNIKTVLIDMNLKWIPAFTDGQPVDFDLSIPINCNSRDDAKGYNFSVTFISKKYYGDQVPYYYKWPYKLSPKSDAWTLSL